MTPICISCMCRLGGYICRSMARFLCHLMECEEFINVNDHKTLTPVHGRLDEGTAA